MSGIHYRQSLLPILFLFTGLTLHSQVKVETSVLAGGGINASNATTRIVGTFGQPIIGTAVTRDRLLWQGFWFNETEGSLSVSSEPVTGESTLQLHCTPNPVSMSATIRAVFPLSQRGDLTLHDLLGREVRSFNTAEYSGSETFELDARELPAGDYTLVLTTGTERVTLPVRIIR